MKGSVTVEAAYIYSFCFLIIAAVCVLGIYAYNCNVLKMTGYECMIKTREERGEGNSLMYENLLKRAQENAAARTFGVIDLRTTVTMTASRISVTYEGIQSLLHLPVKITTTYECTSPEKILRVSGGL